jgi:hypothetical protein
VTVHRLRQRYRELLRSVVSQTVNSPIEVDAELAHSDQAKVGQVGPAIAVPLRERRQLWQVIVAVERQLHQALADHGEHQCNVLQVERRLGQHRLAGQQGLRHLAGETDRPVMMPVPAIGKRHQESGVGDAPHGLEKPWREDKSWALLTIPASRMKERPAPLAFAFSKWARTSWP